MNELCGKWYRLVAIVWIFAVSTNSLSARPNIAGQHHPRYGLAEQRSNWYKYGASSYVSNAIGRSFTSASNEHGPHTEQHRYEFKYASWRYTDDCQSYTIYRATAASTIAVAIAANCCQLRSSATDQLWTESQLHKRTAADCSRQQYVTRAIFNAHSATRPAAPNVASDSNQ